MPAIVRLCQEASYSCMASKVEEDTRLCRAVLHPNSPRAGLMSTELERLWKNRRDKWRDIAEQIRIDIDGMNESSGLYWPNSGDTTEATLTRMRANLAEAEP